MKFKKNGKAILFIFCSWVTISIFIFVIDEIHRCIFEYIVFNEDLANHYYDFFIFDLKSLKLMYPKYYFFIWIYFFLPKMKAVFVLVFLILLYKRVLKWKKEILKFTTFYLTLLLLNLVSDKLISNYIVLPFNQKSIQQNLVLQQITYSDSLGINKLSHKAELSNGYRINSQGFRSRYEFTKKEVNRLKKKSKVIMVIGDSHTEGCCAIPITSSFVDLLDIHESYSTLNFGVGGTDPLQYYLIAKTYISYLKPDCVLIPFCLGNDFMVEERKPKPYFPIHFQTNHGYLNATLPISHPNYQNDIYFSSWIEAKDFYIQNYTIEGTENTTLLFKMFVKTSSFTSLLYYIPRYLKLNRTIKSKEIRNTSNLNVSLKYLKEIKEICKKQNIPFVLIGVPTIRDMMKNQTNVELSYKEQLKDLGLLYPKTFNKKDFVSEENDHMNTFGHEKMYQFIQNKLVKL